MAKPRGVRPLMRGVHTAGLRELILSAPVQQTLTMFVNQAIKRGDSAQTVVVVLEMHDALARVIDSKIQPEGRGDPLSNVTITACDRGDFQQVIDIVGADHPTVASDYAACTGLVIFAVGFGMIQVAEIIPNPAVNTTPAPSPHGPS